MNINNDENKKVIENVINMSKTTRIKYYADIDSLVGKTIVYYGMNVLVDDVFKYVKWEHFEKGITITDDHTDILGNHGNYKIGDKMFSGIKAIYIVKLLDQKDINAENQGYMYMDTAALSHSYELENSEN